MKTLIQCETNFQWQQAFLQQQKQLKISLLLFAQFV